MSNSCAQHVQLEIAWLMSPEDSTLSVPRVWRRARDALQGRRRDNFQACKELELRVPEQLQNVLPEAGCLLFCLCGLLVKTCQLLNSSEGCKLPVLHEYTLSMQLQHR